MKNNRLEDSGEHYERERERERERARTVPSTADSDIFSIIESFFLIFNMEAV
jgi:hypothetical protein